MKKRLLVIVLALALVIAAAAVFTACGPPLSKESRKIIEMLDEIDVKNDGDEYIEEQLNEIIDYYKGLDTDTQVTVDKEGTYDKILAKEKLWKDWNDIDILVQNTVVIEIRIIYAGPNGEYYDPYNPTVNKNIIGAIETMLDHYNNVLSKNQEAIALSGGEVQKAVAKLNFWKNVYYNGGSDYTYPGD